MAAKPREVPKRRLVTKLSYALLGANSRATAREALEGWAFCTPWLIGLVVFVAGPIVYSIYLSLSRYTILRPPTYVGLDNYENAFFHDDLFWPSLARTLRYSLSSVPINLIGSLLLAVMLDQSLRGTNVFRTVFFIPHLTPAVALAILWQYLLNFDVGPINYVLRSIGIANPPNWLGSSKWAINTLVMISAWAGVGGNNMIIFLASLQGVPTDLYEAAEIDGASTAAKFRHITLPMISPTILFNLVLGVIGALKVFSLAYVATSGGPAWATWFYALHLYRNAFEYFRMGYAAALAWIFAAILMAFTFIQFRLAERWVYYEGATN